MKTNISFLLLTVMLLAACDSDRKDGIGEPPPGYWIEDASYVIGYQYGDPILKLGHLSKERFILYITTDESKIYFSPYIEKLREYDSSFPLQTVQDENRFLETAAENSDLHFTGKVSSILHIAFAEHIREIRLTCNRHIDRDHPAGSLLNDWLYCSAFSFGSYIRKGYRGVDPETERWENPNRRLSQFTTDDLHILGSDLLIKGIPTPDNLFGKEVTFYLKVILADGREVDSQCTIRAEDWEKDSRVS